MEQPANETRMTSQTTEQWYSRTRLLKLTTSDSLSWTGMRLELAQHEAVPEPVSGPYLEVDSFAFLLKGGATMEMHYPDGRKQKHMVGPGTLQLLPRQTEYGGSWNASWTYGALQLDRDMMIRASAEVFRGDPETVRLVPTFLFNDPLLYYLGVELTRELQSDNPRGSLYAESLGNMITLYLLRHYSTGNGAHKLPASHLSTTQLRIIDDYIHAHLDQKISLADLANSVRISVPHFERIFRATTHRPPYRYVLDIRLEQARALLEHTPLTIAQVALQCGFSSQSHFTAHFKRFTGMSPARYLRDRRRQN